MCTNSNGRSGWCPDKPKGPTLELAYARKRPPAGAPWRKGKAYLFLRPPEPTLRHNAPAWRPSCAGVAAGLRTCSTLTASAQSAVLRNVSTVLGAGVDATSLSRCPPWSAVASATIPSRVTVTGGRVFGTGDATGEKVVGVGRKLRPQARWVGCRGHVHTHVKGTGSGIPDSAYRRRRRAPPTLDAIARAYGASRLRRSALVSTA